MPDGFLHIQNFTVTKASGMAGCVWAYLLDDHQKATVESVLYERAKAIESAAGPEWAEAAVRSDKHDCLRFRKSFLQENFKEAVHETTRAMLTPVVDVFKRKLFAERESLR